MQFAYLGSGSRGNALLIEDGNTCLLLDCGFSARETEMRLARLGRDAMSLTGIVVTHEHSDHISGVGAVARRYQLPVWMTPGTYQAAKERLGKLPTINLIDPENVFTIEDIALTPMVVPHDAREPCQFVFSNGASRLGVLTDIGHSTAAIEANLDGCHALLLECNHDRAMLFGGDYPQALKDRIGSDVGHLDNDSAANLINDIDCSKLQYLLAVHLSEKNNSPVCVRKTLADRCGIDSSWLQIAQQDEPSSWFIINDNPA